MQQTHAVFGELTHHGSEPFIWGYKYMISKVVKTSFCGHRSIYFSFSFFP